MADDEPGSRTLSPDEAFEVLGNEMRVQILRALGAGDGPQSFSALREAVGVTDSGQFNYHLDRLTGHFVRKSDDGYELRRAGERVVEAVLSGAVTDDPVLERTAIDHPCHFCGAPIEVRFDQERVELFCTECQGTYSRTSSAGGAAADADDGYLGYHPLPPAGVAGRDPATLLRAAWTWGHLELLAAANGVCPRCSAELDRDARVCESHDAGDGLCDECGRRHAVAFDLRCTNCIYDEGGAAVVGLAGSTALVEFLVARGLNPVAPSAESFPVVTRAYNAYEEELLSTDPLEARLTFAVGDDALALTVGDDLSVVDVERR